MAALDLFGLAARVSGGGEVDWAAAERAAADAEERRVVQYLRLIESIARIHGSDSGCDEEEPPGGATPTVPGAPDRPTTSGTAGGRWGALELRALLGRGAFGEVFRAFDPQLEREVALKLLKSTAVDDAELAARILREGRLLARVRHPNVVAVHGVESHDGRLGLWMERIEGRSLETLMREQGPLGARETAMVGIDLCRALAAVHGAGLVHRDVKADNVMRELGGRIVLMDFGIGREATSDAAEISGTPTYIAPEVWAGGKFTPRADLWSLGVLLYYLATGSYPVRASNLEELKGKLRRREIRLLRDERPDLPEALLRAVERALEWDPASRFATAGEMERALAAALGAEATPEIARRPRPLLRRPVAWLAGAALVAAAFTGVVLLRAPDPATAPYTVDASLVRTADGVRHRLIAGDRVGLGDRLDLELEGSRDLYVYVMDRDERGQAYVLFPLPGLELQNPLPGGVRHRLPGAIGGRDRFWVVNSSGGREHVVILASPERQIELEAELGHLPRPEPGVLAQPIAAETVVRLRGIGGLAEGDPGAPLEASADRLFDLAESLAGGAELTRGAWLRRMQLENPGP